MAYAWSRSGIASSALAEGGWAIAQSPILGTTITVQRLQKRGYISLAYMYNEITATLPTKANSLFPMM